MLDEVVKGVRYSEICSKALTNLFLNANTPLDKVVTAVTRPQTPIKEELQELWVWNLIEAFQVEEGYNDKKVSIGFNRSVMDLVGYSLAEFLLRNDRRRLKRCRYCKEFFVANDIRRQRHSTIKCEKMYQRDKKRRQREDDAVRYYTKYPPRG